MKQIFEGKYQSHYFSKGMINTQMLIALYQILNGPYRGLNREIYLDKGLELIALRLEQAIEINKNYGKSCVLQPDDIEHIHHAKDILLRHLDNPPSLLDLAFASGD